VIPITWDAALADSLPAFDGPAVLERDDAAGVRELRPGAILRAPIDSPFERIEAIHDVIQCCYRLAAGPALRAEFPIHAGDLLAIDNRRVLHARNAFDPASGERPLRGCYLDRDELLSRLRALARMRPGGRGSPGMLHERSPLPRARDTVRGRKAIPEHPARVREFGGSPFPCLRAGPPVLFSVTSPPSAM